MQGHKPKVRQSGFDQRWLAGCAIGPVQKNLGFCFKLIGWRRLKVNQLAADGARDHLHGTGRIIAPCAQIDFGHAGVASRKECGVPSE